MLGTNTGAKKVCTCKHKKLKKEMLQKVIRNAKNKQVAVAKPHVPQINLEKLWGLNPGQEAFAFFSVPKGPLPKIK